MRNTFLQKILTAVFIAAIFFTVGCKRTEIPTTPDPTPTNPTGGVVNDATQVTASVSGIVLDETNAPIANAVVTSGTATTTTNTNGMFIFQNISFSKENGNVTVVKAGYFKGIRSFKTTEGKNHMVRIQLMQRTLSGTVNAAAGGTITSNGGATIIFPANAFVTSTGAAYTGTVTVYSRWIDPTAANLPFVIPGDLRGVSTTGVENILETYGMVGAELADASGNVLKIATGKTATVSFPIPASLSATAPASIVLWHFDDATARWKENGTATKSGSTYTAQVDKFSFWNCDVGSTNFINLDYTLINATTNSPLVSTSTRIKRANGSYGYGITNNAGFVSGLVPKNEALVLEVVANSVCGTVFYSQNIGPLVANKSLGNINITLPPSQYLNFTGTLLNCSGASVTNGYVSMYVNGSGGVHANTNATGAFSFSILNCLGTNVTYIYQGIDNLTSQQSINLSGTSNNGNINLGNINTCGLSGNTIVYAAGYENNGNSPGSHKIAKFWRNGIATNLTNGTNDAIAKAIFVSNNDIYVAGREFNGTNYVAKFWKNGVAVNLTNGNYFAQANSIFVSGTDVYVIGDESNATGTQIAKIWKNGIATNLTDGTKNAYTHSIVVDGTDVYIAGEEASNSGNYIGKLWKNGVATDLTSVTNNTTLANSIKIVGTDVYVVGRAYISVNLYKAIIWKNGVAISLTNGIKDAGLYSVDVSGTDVYACGYEYDTFTYPSAKFWKNGIATSLTSGTNYAYTSSIIVKATDVYVGGGVEENPGRFVAKIWKNGIATTLTDGTNDAGVTAMSVQ
jgi:hypothetical protein